MQTLIFKYSLVSLILVLFSSCIKDDVENTYIENFDLLWTELDENYAGFGARNVDWSAVRDVYRPQAMAANSEDELFAICSRMLNNELQDGHTRLVDREDNSFSDDDMTVELEEIYGYDVIQDNYLEEGYDKFGVDDEFHHLMGMIKDENIAYMELHEMEEIEGGWPAKMDAFIENIKDTDGLIIDLRINGGGFTPIGLYLADRFAATRELVFNIQTKNGPEHDDFDDPSPNYIEPKGTTQYTKPIVILTDQFSASNAEDFTLKLVTQEHVTHIGKTTAGIYSNISLQKYLPNGWSFAYSHQLYTYPDGTSPEGVGIIPDMEVLYTKEDWQDGNDIVLEAAIALLN